MGQFEDAAKRALAMTTPTEYVENYLKSHFQCDTHDSEALLDVAAKSCTRQCLCRILDVVLQYLVSTLGVRVDVDANLFVTDQRSMTCLSEFAAHKAKNDAFLSWFATVGAHQISEIWRNVDARSVPDLYRRLRLTQLLMESLDKAGSDGEDSLIMWAMDILGQFHEEFGQRELAIHGMMEPRWSSSEHKVSPWQIAGTATTMEQLVDAGDLPAVEYRKYSLAAG